MPDPILAPLITFVLVLTRTSGWVMTAPFFGTASVPMRFRAFLAIGLSLILTPLQHSILQQSPTAPAVSNLIDLTTLMALELFVGLAMGLAILFLFAGLQLAGQLISQLGGMSVADIFDPTSGTSAPIFSQFLRLVGMGVFMAIGGHRQLLMVMLDSYQWMPPGEAVGPAALTPTLVNVLGLSFMMGLRAAAPIVISLLLSMLILGLISRTLPQLNILAVGFSLNAMVAMATLTVSLAALYFLFDSYLEQTLDHLYDMLQSASP